MVRLLKPKYELVIVVEERKPLPPEVVLSISCKSRTFNVFPSSRKILETQFPAGWAGRVDFP